MPARIQEIVGDSPALKRIFRQAMKAAVLDTPVLIFGEPGSGKESLARAIHRISPRRHESFVKVSCQAATSTVLEDQLFGHETRGPAHAGSNGRTALASLDRAHNGVLFLDEIFQIPLHLQSKLLSILDHSESQPIGAALPIHPNVRLMATTSRDLKACVAQRLFREDLYLRLSKCSIHVPPLRERRDDIPLLAYYFMQKFARRCDKTIEHIPDGAMRFLTEANWPGNIRQLEVSIEQAVAITHGVELQLPGFGDDRQPKSANL